MPSSGDNSDFESEGGEDEISDLSDSSDTPDSPTPISEPSAESDSGGGSETYGDFL